MLVAVLRECVESARPVAPPLCLLAGGETTVTVRGDGQGGRNQELAVAAAQALDGFPVPAVVASLATDGVDGASDAAGGIADDTTVSRAAALGLAPAAPSWPRATPVTTWARSATSWSRAPRARTWWIS